MRGKPLTIKPPKIMWNGEYVPLDSLTPEQRAIKRAECTERVAKVVNRYVQAHPEYFDVICRMNKETDENVNS